MIIGIIFIIPSILGVVAFILKILGIGKWITSLRILVLDWVGDDNATPAILIYFGLMAVAGVFIIHSAMKNIMLAEKNFDNIGDITDLEITEE